MIVTHIRVCVRGLVRNGKRILVSSEAWPTKGDRFYLLPGGAVKYGEYARHAIVREFEEELGDCVENVRYLGVLENIFETSLGLGHEIVLVYEADLVDKALYEKDKIVGVEDDIDDPELYGSDALSLEFYWKSEEEMRREGRPLYPEGVERFF